MRRLTGAVVLGLSACGYPLTQLVVRRGGLRGAALAELVCGGLAVRDASMLASGVTDRLDAVPAALLRLETAVAVVASLAGLHPLLMRGRTGGRHRRGQALRTTCGVRRSPRCSPCIPSGSRFTSARAAHPRRDQQTADVRPIEFPMRLAGIRLGTVNCYLLRAGTGYVLVDTGLASNGAGLERELDEAGCRPGDLRLIVMTHGDLDHTGNGAYLRGKYHAEIAMHRDEFAVTENGDDTLSRRKMALPRRVFSRVTIKVLALLIRSGKFERFRPDLAVDDGYDLAEYGLDATVLHLPGHSRGSIGILTADRDLFCGDLLWNMRGPDTHTIVDDPAELTASVERLRSLSVGMVYPRSRQAVPPGVIQAGPPVA